MSVICEECSLQCSCVKNNNSVAYINDESFFSQFEMPENDTDDNYNGNLDNYNGNLDNDDFYLYEDVSEDPYDPFHSIDEDRNNAFYTAAERMVPIIHNNRQRKLKEYLKEQEVLALQKMYNSRAVSLQSSARAILSDICSKLAPEGVDQIIASFVSDIKMVTNIGGKMVPITITI